MSFTGDVVGSLYKIVWSLQMPASKLSFGNMLWKRWQGAKIISKVCLALRLSAYEAAGVSGKNVVSG